MTKDVVVRASASVMDIMALSNGAYRRFVVLLLSVLAGVAL